MAITVPFVTAFGGGGIIPRGDAPPANARADIAGTYGVSGANVNGQGALEEKCGATGTVTFAPEKTVKKYADSA